MKFNSKTIVSFVGLSTLIACSASPGSDMDTLESVTTGGTVSIAAPVNGDVSTDANCLDTLKCGNSVQTTGGTSGASIVPSNPPQGVGGDSVQTQDVRSVGGQPSIAQATGGTSAEALPIVGGSGSSMDVKITGGSPAVTSSASPTGGNAPTGGTKATGGNGSSQDVLITGGKPATGGARATGGLGTTQDAHSATGGGCSQDVSLTGGKAATGGTTATGGGSSQDFAATGGNGATQDVPPTGGNAGTGGASSTGGMSPTGGTSATGGQSSTGGASSTGGTTSTTVAVPMRDKLYITAPEGTLKKTRVFCQDAVTGEVIDQLCENGGNCCYFDVTDAGHAQDCYIVTGSPAVPRLPITVAVDQTTNVCENAWGVEGLIIPGDHIYMTQGQFDDWYVPSDPMQTISDPRFVPGCVYHLNPYAGFKIAGIAIP